jgi:hypothetical protein
MPILLWYMPFTVFYGACDLLFAELEMHVKRFIRRTSTRASCQEYRPSANERPYRAVEVLSPGPDDDTRTEIGWGAAALLIVGASLALASLAWFLVGLFVN